MYIFFKKYCESYVNTAGLVEVKQVPKTWPKELEAEVGLIQKTATVDQIEKIQTTTRMLVSRYNESSAHLGKTQETLIKIYNLTYLLILKNL